MCSTCETEEKHYTTCVGCGLMNIEITEFGAADLCDGCKGADE